MPYSPDARQSRHTAMFIARITIDLGDMVHTSHHIPQNYVILRCSYFIQEMQPKNVSTNVPTISAKYFFITFLF